MSEVDDWPAPYVPPALDQDLVAFITKLAAVADDEWRQYAACVDTDIDMWFDVSSQEACQSICSTCAVRIECLDDAIRNEDTECVRGGATEDRRVAIMLHRKRHRSAFDADVLRALA